MSDLSVPVSPIKREYPIRFDGRDLVMRPTFQAIAEMERMTGKGLFKLATAVTQGNFGISDIAAIIFAGLAGANTRKPNGQGYEFEEIGEQLIKEGWVEKVKPVGEFVRDILLTGKDVAASGK